MGAWYTTVNVGLDPRLGLKSDLSPVFAELDLDL